VCVCPPLPFYRSGVPGDGPQLYKAFASVCIVSDIQPLTFCSNLYIWCKTPTHECFIYDYLKSLFYLKWKPKPYINNIWPDIFQLSGISDIWPDSKKLQPVATTGAPLYTVHLIHVYMYWQRNKNIYISFNSRHLKIMKEHWCFEQGSSYKTKPLPTLDLNILKMIFQLNLLMTSEAFKY
jgi:hypothetical protein